MRERKKKKKSKKRWRNAEIQIIEDELYRRATSGDKLAQRFLIKAGLWQVS